MDYCARCGLPDKECKGCYEKMKLEDAIRIVIINIYVIIFSF